MTIKSGNNTGAYVGFKASNNTFFGYIGVKSDKKPYFYDTEARRIALTSDIPLVDLKRSKVVTGSNIKGFSITIPQVAYRSYVLNIYQRHGCASMLITTNSVGTVDNNTLQNIVSASDLSTSKSGNVVSVTGASYNYFGVELTMIYQTGVDIDTVINSVTAINA